MDLLRLGVEDRSPTGRSRNSSGWRQKNWSSASSPATYIASPVSRRRPARPHIRRRGSRPCPERSRRSRRRGRRCRCRARGRRWPRPRAGRRCRAGPRSLAAARACSRRDRGDAIRQVRAPGVPEPQASEALDQLHAAAGLEEADRAHLLLHQLGEEAAASDSTDARVPERLSTSGGFQIAIRRSARGAPSRPRAGRRGPGRRAARSSGLAMVAGEHESGPGAVGVSEAAEPAQHVRHVRAEDAAVDVRLVHHHPGEIGQHVPHERWLGSTPTWSMSGLVRIRFERLADRAPLLPRGVAVVDRVAQEGPPSSRASAPGPGPAPWWGRGRGRGRAGRGPACPAPAGTAPATCRSPWPLVTITLPLRAASSASVWWDQSASIPASERLSMRLGWRSSGSGSGSGASPSRAVVTSCSPRPVSSTASKGSGAFTLATGCHSTRA